MLRLTMGSGTVATGRGSAETCWSCMWLWFRSLWTIVGAEIRRFGGNAQLKDDSVTLVSTSLGYFTYHASAIPHIVSSRPFVCACPRGRGGRSPLTSSSMTSSSLEISRNGKTPVKTYTQNLVPSQSNTENNTRRLTSTMTIPKL
jgi:hypothetical protein